MNDDRIYIRELPGGTHLRQTIEICFKREVGGEVYASAPDLGLWVDGAGATEQQALADLEKIIRLQRESLDNLDVANASDYLREMKIVFERIVT